MESSTPLKFCLSVPEYNTFENTTSFANNLKISSSVNLFCAISTTILNASVIYIIFQNKRLQVSSNLILLCLAITDLTAGIFAQPLFAIRMLLLVGHHKTFCWFDMVTIGIGYTLLAMSFFTVSFVTLERYCAVYYPLAHGERFTPERIFTVFGLILIPATLIGFTGTFPGANMRLCFVILVSVLGNGLLLWHIFAYWRIFCTSRKIQRQIRNECLRYAGNQVTLREAKATRTAGSIVLTLTICYFPAMLSTAIDNKVYLFSHYINFWSYTFMLANSTLNPLVYCYNCPEIYLEVRKLWCGKKLSRPGLTDSSVCNL